MRKVSCSVLIDVIVWINRCIDTALPELYITSDFTHLMLCEIQISRPAARDAGSAKTSLIAGTLKDNAQTAPSRQDHQRSRRKGADFRQSRHRGSQLAEPSP